jgi:hypothetical protein
VVLNPDLELDLLRDREDVIHLDSEMANRASKFDVPEQQLFRPQVGGLIVDLRRLIDLRRVRSA